jgi:hypothetical protein
MTAFTKIDLSGNPKLMASNESSYFTQFCTALAETTAVTSLDLSDVGMTSVSASVLAEKLLYAESGLQKTLTALDLRRNPRLGSGNSDLVRAVVNYPVQYLSLVLGLMRIKC